MLRQAECGDLPDAFPGYFLSPWADYINWAALHGVMVGLWSPRAMVAYAMASPTPHLPEHAFPDSSEHQPERVFTVDIEAD